jgi:hypothetical protein
VKNWRLRLGLLKDEYGDQFGLVAALLLLVLFGIPILLLTFPLSTGPQINGKVEEILMTSGRRSSMNAKVSFEGRTIFVGLNATSNCLPGDLIALHRVNTPLLKRITAVSNGAACSGVLAVRNRGFRP